MGNYQQIQKAIRIEEIRSVLVKIFNDQSEIKLNVFIEEYFTKRHISPDSMLKYLKTISLVLPIEVNIKENIIKKKYKISGMDTK